MTETTMFLIIGGLVNLGTLLSLFAGLVWGYATMSATVRQVKSDVSELKSKVQNLDRLDHILGTLKEVVDELQHTLRNGLTSRITELERQVEVMKAICTEHRKQLEQEYQNMMESIKHG